MDENFNLYHRKYTLVSINQYLLGGIWSIWLVTRKHSCPWTKPSLDPFPSVFFLLLTQAKSWLWNALANQIANVQYYHQLWYRHYMSLYYGLTQHGFEHVHVICMWNIIPNFTHHWRNATSPNHDDDWSMVENNTWWGRKREGEHNYTMLKTRKVFYYLTYKNGRLTQLLKYNWVKQMRSKKMIHQKLNDQNNWPRKN